MQRCPMAKRATVSSAVTEQGGDREGVLPST